MKKDLNEQIKQMLIEEGATEIEHYTLVNNDGFTFRHKNKRYDLRHWRNSYGASCDFWHTHILTLPTMASEDDKAFMKKISEKANEINEA